MHKLRLRASFSDRKKVATRKNAMFRICFCLQNSLLSMCSAAALAEKVVGEKLLTYSSYWHKSACFLTIFLKKSQKKKIIQQFQHLKQIRITPTMLIT